VFFYPDGDWSIARIAAVLGTSQGKVRHRLFMESHCLTVIVRQQRAQRALLESLATDRISGPTHRL
jgi:AraC-like DNA-binding protein